MFEREIAKRILEIEKKRVGPFTLQLNPTNRCNLRCRFCWLRDFDEGGLNLDEISTKRYKELIKEAYQLKVRVIEITGGGEPLMRRDLLGLMKFIKKFNIFGRLITNGTLFTERMIKELIKIGWDEIVFSLDAPEKKINNFLRGGGFEEAVKALRSFQLKKFKLKQEKPSISIHMVLCNKNYHLLPKMFEFAYELNCRNLLVEPIVLLAKKTKAGKELMFKKKDRKKLMKAIKEATQFAYQHNFQTNVDKLEYELIKHASKMKKVVKEEGKKEKNPWLSIPCYQPFYSLVIRPWGDAGPCCMFESSCENIRTKSLKQIWFSKYFEEIRKNMKNKKLPKFCSICNAGQVFENRRIREELSKWMKK